MEDFKQGYIEIEIDHEKKTVEVQTIYKEEKK
jgi:hypothetical protein